MKAIIILFLILFTQSFPQQITLTGYVNESESNSSLIGANVYFNKSKVGSYTDSNGKFIISGNILNDDTLIVSFLGYNKIILPAKNINFNEEVFISLDRIILPSQSVLVSASIGKKGITPVAFEQINRSEIQKDYSVQDIPNYLSRLPSTTFYSENGNGIGYNYLSIRGFDQRRISVSINGIPQNDPEDHNIYWLDLPDLLAGTEMIQVQRGAGSGVLGYPAIGGSINIITSPFSDKPKFNLSASYGSYNTRKYSAGFASGLINNKYSIYAKLSQILSSGYRQKSWSKFNSYHLSFVRYDEALTSQLNFYGGPIEDGLAYTGIAKFAVKDKNLRTENYSYWESDETGYTFTIKRRSEEIENFSQPHFELLNELELSNQVKLNSALFLVLGNGFFDYDGSWSIFYDDYFRLRQNGFDSSSIPTNAIIRANVENKQYGWIPRMSILHSNGELIVGGEFRIHRSDHWGSIGYAENLPPRISKDYRYYFYNGSKNIFSAFAHENYKLTDKINLLGELQLTYHQYKLLNERYVENDFTISNTFFNPRFGVNYKLSEKLNTYFSFARVTREPRLKDYYDAAESSGGELPKFELNVDGSYNFNSPFVKPETMNDFEFGTTYTNNKLSFSLNFFYMIFQDEIVKNGKVDRFGQPITGNVDKTIHRGIEVTILFKPIREIELFANATYSNNFIVEGKYFIDSVDYIKLNDNSISGFPDFLANAGVSFSSNNIYARLSGKYVGKLYSDNYDGNLKDYLLAYPGFVDYSDNVNDSYFSADLFASYEFYLFNSKSQSKLFIQVNNLFDNLYSAYAIGKEFFPAAERNFIVGFQLGL